MRPLKPRPATGAFGRPLVHLEITSSTNDRAQELALAGAADGTVVVAEEQSAGRGRHSRTWSAARGRALTLSAVARLPEQAFALLPLGVALAVCETCESVAAVRCLIKWPNDIWVERRKLAGILIEARPQDGWAVIGVGLNVNTETREFPDELRETATSLRIESGEGVNRDRALDALFEHLSTRLAELRRGDTAPLLSAYRSRDALRGENISWETGGRSRTGEAQGVDERGNLVVFTGDGERLTLDAGEVHLL